MAKAHLTIEIDIASKFPQLTAILYSLLYRVKCTKMPNIYNWPTFQFTGNPCSLAKLVKFYSAGQEPLDTFVI